MSSTPRRILVTGGAGFIGMHTVQRLAADGFALLVIDDLRHACGEPLPPGVDLETVDLTDPASASVVTHFRPHVILHLAAQGGVSRSVRDPAGDAMVNVVATVGLLRASVDADCRRVIFASSGGAIYGHAPHLPTPERTTPAPLSPYGAAKLAAEGYLGMFSRSFGLSTLALRYSNVYGPYQDGTGEAGGVHRPPRGGARRSCSPGAPARRCEMDSGKPSGAFRNGPGGHRRPPPPGQPQPKPEKVTDRAQDRNEARPRPDASDTRIMPHRYLRDPKPAALGFEVELGVEQRGPGQQRRGRFEHLAAHQLETAIEVTDPNAVQPADQQVEDARDHEPVARVGAVLPPARSQAGASHQAAERDEAGRSELTIAIHEGDVLRARGSEPIGHGDAVATLALVPDDAQPAGLPAHRAARHVDGVISAAVVDQHDLPLRREPGKRPDRPADHLDHVRRLVVRRDDEG